MLASGAGAGRPERHGHGGVLGHAGRHRSSACSSFPGNFAFVRAAGTAPQAGEAPAPTPAPAAAAPCRAGAPVRRAAPAGAGGAPAGRVHAWGPTIAGPTVTRRPTSAGAIRRRRAAESLGDLAWWEIFQDETLQTLIRDRAGRELRPAHRRGAHPRRAGPGDDHPLVPVPRRERAPASAPYSRIDGDRAPLQFTETRSARSGGLDLSFELDFWGRLRRATEAARAELLATEEGPPLRDQHPGHRRGHRVLPAPHAGPGAGDLPPDARPPAGLAAARQAPRGGRRGGHDGRAPGRDPARRGGRRRSRTSSARSSRRRT